MTPDARSMEQYWDRRAREDAFHYVDSREQLGSPDRDAFWRGGEEVVDRLLGALHVELTNQEDVLEIGCGIGRLTRVLARRARSVQALDVSREMLAQAQMHNPTLGNVQWIRGDGSTLAPLPTASCDACVSFVVFQHLPTAELTYGYVREMGRVLRAGGWAAFQVSNDPRAHRRPAALTRLRRALKRRLQMRRVRGRYDHPSWRGSAVDIAELAQVAAGAGLELERVENEGLQFCFVLARRRA